MIVCVGWMDPKRWIISVGTPIEPQLQLCTNSESRGPNNHMTKIRSLVVAKLGYERVIDWFQVVKHKMPKKWKKHGEHEPQRTWDHVGTPTIGLTCATPYKHWNRQPSIYLKKKCHANQNGIEHVQPKRPFNICIQPNIYMHQSKLRRAPLRMPKLQQWTTQVSCKSCLTLLWREIVNITTCLTNL